MALLSEQLRNIAGAARDQAGQQQAVQGAQLGQQVGQAIGASAGVGAGPQGKRAAQQLAAGASGAQQQIATQAQAGLQQTMGQLGQQGLQQQAQQQQQRLTEQQMISDADIAELQREGKLRQNSAALNQAKELQQSEIDMQRRLTGAQLEYDNTLSFLTRKQREDLANLGTFTKQILFDQRLTFKKDEAGRKFTNMQQLADYAVASAEDQVTLQNRMREMTQAAEKEYMALEHAHKLIVNRMQKEFERAEKTKDYALLQKLKEYENAMKEKMRRKKAKAAMISNIIIGGATIAGAAFGGPPGAMAGAAVGQTVAGGAQASGAY